MQKTRSSKFDMTVGPVLKTILAFAIPIILGNMLQQLYNTVDGIVVGRVVNSNALAAIGTCSTLARFFICFSMGFSNGCGVIMAQLYGARRYDKIKKAFTTGMIIALGIGVVVSALGLTFHSWILYSFMDIKDPDVFGYADTYFSIYCMGLIFMYAYNFIAYILRSFGDSRATLYFLALTSVLNLILDLFMVQFWGIAGAAIATVISQIVCAVVSFIYMSKRHEALNIRLREYRVDREMAKNCVILGIPAILQQSSASLGNLVMQRLVNGFGNTVMAAYTVGTKLEGYMHAPLSGIQQSMATFAGQNIGAKKLDRVKKGLYLAFAINMVVCVFWAVVCLVGGDGIAALFALDGESFDYAMQMIRFYSYASPTLFFFGAYFCCAGVIHGSGDVAFATFITLSALLTRVVLSYTAVYAFSVDCNILWYSTLVSNGLSMVLAWARYYSGRWKKKSERIVGKPNT